MIESKLVFAFEHGLQNLGNGAGIMVARRDRLREQLAKVEGALAAFENPSRRHKMDEKARANIAAAQKARWAKWRKEQGKSK